MLQIHIRLLRQRRMESFFIAETQKYLLLLQVAGDGCDGFFLIFPV
jgi:hypothetical protein